ncbi:MAG TPA: PilZ domain-containing protein [Bacillota bacterium]|jgi:c-di-GMP-binding flagellar brake protein YcgR|nr:PilZ domain-containing protein [Bacillota bacterium]
MQLPLFEPGGQIRVRLAAKDDFPSFATKIEGKADSGYWIYAPYTDDYRSMVRAQDELEVSMMWKGAVYFFGATVIGEKHDRVKLLLISDPEFIRREQRREFVRVPVMFDAQIACNPATQDASADEWVTVVASDISGGGIGLFIWNKDVPAWLLARRRIRVAMPIGQDGSTVKVMGQVVRLEKPDEGPTDGVNVGVKFIEISESERRVIIRFVFDRQRELIRKSAHRSDD